jgi:hypothetical protein
VFSDRSDITGTTDEALGSETEIFPDFPAAPEGSTDETESVNPALRVIRDTQ